jgi:uncharacterized membrane protein
MTKKVPKTSTLPTAKSQNNGAKDARQINSTLQVSAQYSGPIPPPEILNRYNELLPGAADRIIAMAEAQAKHRQTLEQIAIKSGARDSMLGLIFGLTIGLAGISGSVFCIINGYQAGGTILGTGSLASLVGVFVYGSRQRREERERKSQR